MAGAYSTGACKARARELQQEKKVWGCKFWKSCARSDSLVQRRMTDQFSENGFRERSLLAGRPANAHSDCWAMHSPVVEVSSSAEAANWLRPGIVGWTVLLRDRHSLHHCCRSLGAQPHSLRG